MNQLNLYRGIYDENGNLFYEGHRFFWIKVHIKYLGETTSKFQFTSTIIAEYPDGTTYKNQLSNSSPGFKVRCCSLFSETSWRKPLQWLPCRT